MGLLSKSQKAEEDVSGDSPEGRIPSPNDPEKAEMAIEGDNQTSVPATAPQIDPELEKRVVRKLDKRLVSLVFVLCA